MVANTLTHTTNINPNNTNNHGPMVDEVEGLIRVYKDGHVERSQLIPCVGPSLPFELGVTCSDIHIDMSTNLWARLYIPKSSSVSNPNPKLPLLVYFHGGGFCVGSASWSCYHEFLARLSASSRCLVMSVNYRLAPENPLPAAYEDGVSAILWLKKTRNDFLWAKLCDFARIFLAGDSAGGNIANHVAAKLADDLIKPLKIEGTILIQPFFGGEARTESERRVGNNNKKGSVLSLAASDAWWRLALPRGANREHPYCKPARSTVKRRTVVCVAEMDVLMDREMEMCYGNDEEMIKCVVYKGVGHAFHILGKSQLSHTTTLEMLCHINAFIHHYDPFH